MQVLFHLSLALQISKTFFLLLQADNSLRIEAGLHALTVEITPHYIGS